METARTQLTPSLAYRLGWVLVGYLAIGSIGLFLSRGISFPAIVAFAIVTVPFVVAWYRDTLVTAQPYSLKGVFLALILEGLLLIGYIVFADSGTIRGT